MQTTLRPMAGPNQNWNSGNEGAQSNFLPNPKKVLFFWGDYVPNLE
jgi:hypothetical protein